MNTKKAAKIAPILLAILALGLTITTLAAISTNNNPQNQNTPTTQPTLVPTNQPVTTSQPTIDPSTDPTPVLTTTTSPNTNPTTTPTAPPAPTTAPTLSPSANPSPKPIPTPTPTTPPTIEASLNLGIYTNNACTNLLNSISWGSVNAGTNTTQTIYLKNLGNTPITLNLSATAWQPTNASSYLSISWDKQAAILNAGQSTQATITLTISTSVEGITDFNTELIISGIS